MRSKKLLWMGWIGVMALLVGTVAWSVLASREPPSLNWEPTFESALAKAKAEHKPVMVDFYADWCGPCRMMEQTTFRDSDIRKLADDLVCVRVNTDERPALSNQYGAYALPTLLFLSPDGKAMRGGTGYLEADKLAPIMQSVLQKPPKR